jgi:amidase
MAVGTETDGSITCPASLNGVVGIKPTVGSIPTSGIVPISSSQDTPGPMARTVDDAEKMLAVLMDDASLLQRSRSVDVSALTLGVVDAWRTGHHETDALFDQSLSLITGLIKTVSTSAMPATPDDVHHDEFTVLVHELRSDLDAYLQSRSHNGSPSSVQDVVAFNLAHADRELEYFGQEIFEMAAASEGRLAEEYVLARQRNLEWTHSTMDVALSQHDVLIAPAYMPAWKTDFATGHPPSGGAVSTPAAIAGLPILTLPIGLVTGLPVALSLVGAKNSEPMLIALAKVVEKVVAVAHDPAWRPQFLKTIPSA